MTPTLLLDVATDVDVSPVRIGVKGGVWTAVPIPQVCVCGGVGSCLRCAIDEDIEFVRSNDI